eukprot:jgi/Botrbrau1/5065/Bobra.37_1s0029.1
MPATGKQGTSGDQPRMAAAPGVVLRTPGNHLPRADSGGTLESRLRRLLRLFATQAPKDLNGLLNRAGDFACDNGPALLIGAFKDPDPVVACAAAMSTVMLMEDPCWTEPTLEAGVAPALVALLAHPTPFCASGALWAISEMLHLPGGVAALLDAGLVPQMVAALAREAPSGTPAPGALAEVEMGPDEMRARLHQHTECVLWLMTSPKLACQGELSKQMAQPGPLAILARGARGKEGGPSSAACLSLISVLVTCCEDPAQKEVLARALVSTRKFPTFVRAAGSRVRSIVVLNAVTSLVAAIGPEWLLQKDTAGVIRMCVEYAEADPAPTDAWKAGFVIAKLQLAGNPAALPPLGRDPPRLVQNIVASIRDQPSEVGLFFIAYRTVVSHLEGDINSGKVARAALAGGLVPYLLRLMRDCRNWTGPAILEIVKGLCLVLHHADEGEWLKALRNGLPAVVKTTLESASAHQVRLGVAMLHKAVRFKAAVPPLKAAGVLPDLLLSLYESSDALVLKSLGDLLIEISMKNPDLAEDLLAAGAVAKVGAACSIHAGNREVGKPLEAGLMTLFTARSGLLNLTNEHAVQMQAEKRAAGTRRTAANKGPGQNPTQESSQPAKPAGPKSAERPAAGPKSAKRRAQPAPDRRVPLAEALSQFATSMVLGAVGFPMSDDEGLTCSDDESPPPSPSQMGSSSAAGNSGAKRRPKEAREKSSRALKCANCGVPNGAGFNLQQCQACKSALYCGRECQRKHWPTHKGPCRAHQDQAKASRGA